VAQEPGRACDVVDVDALVAVVHARLHDPSGVVRVGKKPWHTVPQPLLGQERGAGGVQRCIELRDRPAGRRLGVGELVREVVAERGAQLALEVLLRLPGKQAAVDVDRAWAGITLRGTSR
jgi:hypothetical protein